MKWYVRSLDDLHPDIPLKPDEVISLGRSSETGIKDKTVSKLHTLFKFQPAKETVICKQLGRHPALINGTPVLKDMKVRIGLSSTIELLAGRYRYTIVQQQNTGSKRKLSDMISTPPKKTCSSGRVSRDLSEMVLRRVECTGTASNSWTVTKDLVVRDLPTGSSKIAAFDMDHTLITTRSGNVFPKDINDWEIMWPAKVKPKLKELHEDGYKVLIISNQNGIESKKITVEGFQSKVESVVKQLGVPVQVLAAPCSTATRKPAPGMWMAFEKFYNCGVTVDYTKSFYVGDAAGRLADWQPKKKKDFSSSDREFAENVALTFYTPEAFFLGQKETDKWSWKSFDARSYLDKTQPLLEAGKTLQTNKQEVLIMVGYPGSGKSTFSKAHLPSYTRINLDEMKSFEKCISVMDSALGSGKSVVVDNTNADAGSRKRYLEVAAKFDVSARCLVMTTTLDHAKHNNRFRRLMGSGEQVPGIAFNTFKSRYQEPNVSEGYTDILRVNILPEFPDPSARELYCMFLGG